MHEDFLMRLKNASATQLPQGELRDALKHLDLLLQDIARDLRVEHVGPEVGLSTAPAQHRLVVREHIWNTTQRGWGAAICTIQESSTLWRADWPLHAASRERQHIVAQKLPDFFKGYWKALEVAGLSERNSAKRIAAIATLLET